MKLEHLEAPFDKKWKYGYIITNKENRKIICLYADNKTRKTISYARYLMSVKLGRELTNEETVDHIDDDRTNDSIDNIQILSIDENRNKYIKTQKHNIHGTNSMYRKGCRCVLCKEWKHNFYKNYSLEHPEKIKDYLEKKKLKRKNLL